MYGDQQHLFFRENLLSACTIDGTVNNCDDVECNWVRDYELPKARALQ